MAARRSRLIDLPESFEPADSSGRANRSLRFDLVTPMMGGSTESWVLDQQLPVRAQSVKGHLRFWWRTMQKINDPRELLRRENALFGGPVGDQERRKSAVSISVVPKGEPTFIEAEMETEHVVKGDVVPRYVLFPITSDVRKGRQIHYLTQYSFDLDVSYPVAREADVLDTLTLWCLFGGVGARTRRGCGSLYCEELLQPFSGPGDVYGFVTRWGCNANGPRHVAPYPCLKDALLALKPTEAGHSDAVATWRRLVERYADYRQGRGIGRRQGDQRPGRSYWPEPDAMRTVSRRNDPRHPPEHPDGVWFPRAAYGLPIITTFKDKTDPGGGGNVNLHPQGRDRWPSPVILKAVRLPRGTPLSCCLILNAAPPEGLVLTGAGAGHHTLKSDELPLATARPGRKMKTNDPLRDGETPYTALLRFLGMEAGE